MGQELVSGSYSFRAKGKKGYKGEGWRGEKRQDFQNMKGDLSRAHLPPKHPKT